MRSSFTRWCCGQGVGRRAGLQRGLTPLHLLSSSFQIASLVRHFDRNEITIWASEKSSVMKKCKAAVSPFSLPAPAAPPPRSWSPMPPEGPRLEGSGELRRIWRGEVEEVCEQSHAGGNGLGAFMPRVLSQDVALILQVVIS